MYTTAVNDLMLLFLFLMIGVVLRQIIKPLRKLYLPSVSYTHLDVYKRQDIRYRYSTWPLWCPS